MTFEIKATCLSRDLREAMSKVFKEKKKKGELTDLEDMFWFIVDEMPECPKEE